MKEGSNQALKLYICVIFLIPSYTQYVFPPPPGVDKFALYSTKKPPTHHIY